MMLQCLKKTTMPVTLWPTTITMILLAHYDAVEMF